MAPTPNAAAGPSQSAPPERRSPLLSALARMSPRSLDRWIVAFLCLLVFVVFFHTVNGEWVYDDGMQIADNPWIKDRSVSTVVKALTSDVWGFMSPTGEAYSRYYRPTFVGWMIIHQRLFDVWDPLPWRLSTVLTHMLATVLAFRVVRRLGLSSIAGAAVGVVFAIHPSRAESAAWVAGVTDPLLAVFLFTSIIALLRLIDPPDVLDPGSGVPAQAAVGRFGRIALWGVSLLCYVLALGCKEVAMLFPAVVFAIAAAPASWSGPGPMPLWSPARLKRAALVTAPYLALAAAFAVVRRELLGPEFIGHSPLGFEVNIFTLPLVGIFYVKQSLLPYHISSFYPLEHVLKPDLNNFFVPGVIFLVLAGAMLLLAFGKWRSRASITGLVLFVSMIAPAAYVTHFPPDTLVHDRYLYIPLLGMLLLVVAPLKWFLVRRASRGAAGNPRDAHGLSPAWRADAVILSVGLICMGALGYQSLRYAAAWKSNYGMWGWAARACPDSQYCLHHWGLELTQAKRYAEARAVYERAIDIRPEALTYLALADCLLSDDTSTDSAVLKRNADEAERLLLLALGHYEKFRAYTKDYVYGLDVLARVYLERDDDLDRAVAVYRRGVPNVSNRRGYLYDRMGMIALKWGMDHNAPERFKEAEQILSEGRQYIDQDPTAQARMILYRLGDIYGATGRPEQAREAFESFLRMSEGFTDQQIVEHSKVARAWLQQNPRGGSPAPAPGAGAPGGAMQGR
ncbi:MAG TPA: tetratricopeptide repeat protein [Phycisphaerales bacterium]|nr:tetratricopeptide repeat protein [Phycisphaerales bacterium]